MTSDQAAGKRPGLVKTCVALIVPPILLFTLFAILYHPFPYPVYILMLNHSILFLLLLAFLKADDLSLADIGWRIPGAAGLFKLIAAGLLLGVAMRVLDRLVLVKLSDRILGLFRVSVSPESGGENSPLWAWILVVTLFAGVVEESIFRGYVLSGFRCRLHPAWAILISSAAFGLFHFGLGVENMLDAVLFGAVLGAIFSRWPSVWPLALAHAIANLMELIGH
jgi:membrane protease YdiL (CAAX protease family)